MVRPDEYKNLQGKDIPYQFRNHAWFTCYAPAEKPEIAVTVLMEHGRYGSAAVPIAQAVLKQDFSNRLRKQTGILISGESDVKRASCKMKIFVQDRGRRKILPQAYS